MLSYLMQIQTQHILIRIGGICMRGTRNTIHIWRGDFFLFLVMFQFHSRFYFSIKVLFNSLVERVQCTFYARPLWYVCLCMNAAFRKRICNILSDLK